MLAYIINLDRSKERYQFVSKQFDDLGVAYHRISAVDKNSQSSFEHLQTDFSNWPKMYAAEFACFLSHMKCWEEIANGQDSHGAVFEDDVVVSKDIKNYLSSNLIPKNIDVLQIETFNTPVKVNLLGGKLFLNRKAVKLIEFQPGGAGYILSKLAAKGLLEICGSGLNCPVDHFLFDQRFEVVKRFNVRHLNEGLIIQQDRLDVANPAFQSEICLRSSSDLPLLNKKKLSLKQKIYRELMRIYNKFYYKFFTKNLIKIEFK